MTTNQKLNMSDSLSKLAHRIRIIEGMIEDEKKSAIKLRETSSFWSEHDHEIKVKQLEIECLKAEIEWHNKTSELWYSMNQ